MTHITIERAKLEQWVKAVVSVARYAPAGEGVFSAVMMARDDMSEVLKQALAAPPVQEPVATVIEELEHDGEGFCAKVRWLYNPVPLGETLSWEQPK